MKKHYLPKGDIDKAVWLTNFSIKLNPIGASLGLLPAEITAIKNDAAYYRWVLEIVQFYKTEIKERVKYKDILRDGPLGSPLGTFPTTPTLPTMPTVVPAGIFQRVSTLVQRIKNHPSYNQAIGIELGIIGAEQTINTTEMKPILKLHLTGGGVEIQWTKGQADAIRIEKLVGSATAFTFLAINTKPNFLDRTPISEPVVWKYRAIYLINDTPVGNFSDIAQITVGNVI